MQADRNRLATVLLQALGAAVSLCREASELQVEAAPEGDHACVRISWIPGPPPEFSPFSRPELGLVIAQAAWESCRGHWVESREENRHVCTLQFPLTLCLPGGKQQIGDDVFKSMSSRAVEMLKEDMEVLGPVKSRDIHKAQLEAVGVARKLEAEGKISLTPEGDDEYVA